MLAAARLQGIARLAANMLLCRISAGKQPRNRYSTLCRHDRELQRADQHPWQPQGEARARPRTCVPALNHADAALARKQVVVKLLRGVAQAGHHALARHHHPPLRLGVGRCRRCRHAALPPRQPCCGWPQACCAAGGGQGYTCCAQQAALLQSRRRRPPRYRARRPTPRPPARRRCSPTLPACCLLLKALDSAAPSCARARVGAARAIVAAAAGWPSRPPAAAAAGAAPLLPE